MMSYYFLPHTAGGKEMSYRTQITCSFSQLLRDRAKAEWNKILMPHFSKFHFSQKRAYRQAMYNPLDPQTMVFPVVPL